MNLPSQPDSQTLPDDIQWALQRADGFTDLRMYAQAHAAMGSIPEDFHTSLPYRVLQLRLAMEENAWPTARKFARSLHEAHPEEVSLWIQLAYATRRSQGIPEAQAILVDASAVFPDEALIPYNLSCYACCEGDLSAARTYLQSALAIDRAYLALAMEDDDLEPLWEEIEDL